MVAALGRKLKKSSKLARIVIFSLSEAKTLAELSRLTGILQATLHARWSKAYGDKTCLTLDEWAVIAKRRKP